MSCRKAPGERWNGPETWGAGALCIEDNIDCYGKSGFVMAGTKGIRYHGEPE